MKRALTGQDPERESRDNLVTITRGEFNKAALEERLLPPLMPEPCGAVRRDKACFYAIGHTGRCSWDV